MFKRIVKFFGLMVASLFFLVGCNFPGINNDLSGQDVVVTGGGNTESDLLAYIVSGLINHYTGLEPLVVPGLGSSSMNHQAMLNGDANISAARFTGTAVTGELGLDPIRDPQKAEEVVMEEFDQRFDQKWYPSYGYENTYAFIVRSEDAEEYGIEKVSDLESYADSITVATDINWINREGDGYEAFKEIYGFEFQNLNPMTLALTYEALANNEVDVILGYSTDAKIIANDFVVLEDDRQVFPPYETAFIARHDLLETYPELDPILQKLVGSIDEETMQGLNYQTDTYLLEPEYVANQFLEENNYFEEKEPHVEVTREGEPADD